MAAPRMLPIVLSERDVARFWTRVQRTEGCWPWTGKVTVRAPLPRGHFSLRGRPYLASRVAWTIANGPIPDGLWVLHHCDNAVCCNPAHLFLGTRSDNSLDMIAKGRQSRPRRLPDDVMRQMLARFVAGESSTKIAEAFGIRQSTFSNITHGRCRRALAAEFIPALRPPAPAPRQGVLFPDASRAA